MHLVSVVIPTKNRSSLLKDAIESVLAIQSDSFNIEIIVVDDGSTDNTADVAAAYPVQYHCTAGLEASAARNIGKNAATGDFIAFLDDDDVWLPTNIAPQVRLLESRPELGAAHGQAWPTGPDLVPYGAPFPAGPLPSGWIFNELLTYWPQLGSIVVRADVAAEVGDFDTSLHSEEEWDWILRIARRYPIGRIEQPVMLFRQRGSMDDELNRRRLPDTVRVFHRHTRHMGAFQRLLLQRVIWNHRGWYSAIFLTNARHYFARGARQSALRCIWYALQASPVHSMVNLLKASPYRLSR